MIFNLSIILRLLLVTLVSSFLLVFYQLSFAKETSTTPACRGGEVTIYCKKIIKSRANQNYTNNGTSIYATTVITHWDDDLIMLDAQETLLNNHDDSVDALGNVKVKDEVRQVNNLVEVKTDVNSQLDHLKIGTINVENEGASISNIVEVDGAINYEGEGDIEIGTINIEGGSVNSVNSSIKVEAIESNGKNITIGGVKITKSREVKKINSQVIVNGDVDAQ